MNSDWRTDQFFRTLIDLAADGVIVIDPAGTVRVYNLACERLFGYAPAEVLGRNVRMLMPEPYHSAHDGYLASYRATGEKRIIGIGREVTGRRKDGSVFPMYLSVGEGTSGGDTFFVGIIHDLTGLKHEAALHAATDRLLARIVEYSDDAIISKTMDGAITSWNAAAARMFGYSAAEAVGRNIAMLFPPERLAEEEEIMARLRRGEAIDHFETVRRHKDGGDVIVSLSISPILEAGGKVAGASKIVRDITAQKTAEAQAHQLQDELAHVARLNSMGQMSAAIAHELNQPLSAIVNYLNAAQRFLAGEHPDARQIAIARETMEKAAAQTVRAGAIIRHLRDFVERRDAPRSNHDINDIIREAVGLCFVGSLSSDVKVTYRLAPALPPVPVNKVQIQQVLTNLVRNSLEAMQNAPARELMLSSALAEPGWVRLEVHDSGPGFSAEMLGKLFQPFMTTKETGMGMGLKICHSLIEAHEGRIRALATGPGAGFEILLPIALDHESEPQ